ncbi:hypothetical protein [Haladaptatus sp. NG-WS-4]
MNHQFVAAPIRQICFWSSIALPLLYVPLLLDGLTGNVVLLFVGLVCLHVLTLYLGHDHRHE